MSYVTAAFLILSAVSTGTVVYAQQQQAKSQERAAKYNNRLAENEAKNRELESHEAIKRQRIENRRRLSRIRAQLSSQGTLTTTGSPLAILGESAGNFELAVQDAHRSSNIQAASLRAQGQMGLWEADQARQAANISSAATIASGASSAFGSYSDSVYSNQNKDTFGLYRTKTTS